MARHLTTFFNAQCGLSDFFPQPLVVNSNILTDDSLPNVIEAIASRNVKKTGAWAKEINKTTTVLRISNGKVLRVTYTVCLFGESWNWTMHLYEAAASDWLYTLFAKVEKNCLLLLNGSVTWGCGKPYMNRCRKLLNLEITFYMYTTKFATTTLHILWWCMIQPQTGLPRMLLLTVIQIPQAHLYTARSQTFQFQFQIVLPRLTCQIHACRFQIFEMKGKWCEKITLATNIFGILSKIFFFFYYFNHLNYTNDPFNAITERCQIMPWPYHFKFQNNI